MSHSSSSILPERSTTCAKESMSSLTRYALGLQQRHQIRLALSGRAKHYSMMLTVGAIGLVFIHETVYGEFGGTDSPYGILPNLLASLNDHKNFTRPEMLLKDRLVNLYEHNAYHDEQVRKGLEPKGEKLTLWM